MNREQMDEYIALVRAGLDSDEAVERIRIKSGLVKSTPSQFNSYITNNYARMQGWKSQPLWVKDNQKTVLSIVK